MPAALNVNREAVRVLALAIGVREAARQMKLPEATVQAWSNRGNWFAHKALPVQSAPVTKIATKTVSVQPADVMAAIGERSKLALAKAGEKGANYLQKLSGKELAKQSGHYKNVIDGASKLHGWDTRFQAESFNLNILNLGGLVSVDTPDS